MRSNLLFGFLATHVCLVLRCTVASDDRYGSNDEKRLMDSLFQLYDRRVRPTKSSDSVLEVTVDYALVSLLGIEERDQQMTAFGWIEMVWVDEYLQLNRSEYNLEYIVVDAKDIWYPDLVIRNSADQVYGDVLDYEKYRVDLYSDGSVNFYTAGKTTTFCKLDLTYFPFDVQACYIHIDSWTYSETQVLLNSTNGKLITNLYHPNGQWQLEDTEVIYSHEMFTGDIYSELKFTLYLRRKPLYFTTNLVIPCTLMSLIVLFVFLLPADADEKVSLSITVLLSFSVFQLMVSGSMPETSDYVPLIIIYITFVMVLAALSLLSTVLVLMIHHHTCHVGPPKWLQKLMFQYFARLVCMRKKSERVELNMDDELDQQQFHDNLSRESTSSTNIDIMMGENQTGHGKFYDGRIKPEQQNQQQKQQLHLEDVSGYETDFSLNHSQEIENLDAVFDLVRTSTAKLKKDELVSIWREQWSEIARIFDRLLLFLFLGITIVVCVVLLGILPLFGPTMVQPQNLS